MIPTGRGCCDWPRRRTWKTPGGPRRSAPSGSRFASESWEMEAGPSTSSTWSRCSIRTRRCCTSSAPSISTWPPSAQSFAAARILTFSSSPPVPAQASPGALRWRRSIPPRFKSRSAGAETAIAQMVVVERLPLPGTSPQRGLRRRETIHPRHAESPRAIPAVRAAGCRSGWPASGGPASDEPTDFRNGKRSSPQ